MHDMNEHMDEMFRRAAENYPLKTDGADWGKMAAMIAHEEADTNDDNNIQAKKRNPFKYLSILILLFAFPWIYLKDAKMLSNGGKAGNATAVTSSKKDEERRATMAQHPVDATGNEGANIGEDNNTKAVAGGEQNPAANPSNTMAKTDAPSPGGAVGDNGKVTKNTFAKTEKRNRGGGFGPPSVDGNGEKYSFDIGSGKAVKMKKPIAGAKEKVTDNDYVDGPDGDGSKKMDVAAEPKNDLVETQKTESQSTDSTTKDDKLATADPVPSNEEIAKKEKDKKPRERFFYVGAMAGPDASVVKFQRLKTLGINAGLILGFQLNKRWAIETGMYWDKKYYYTKGEHFSPVHLYLPANMKLNNAEGNCSMWEMPINIKYTFTSNAKRNWFVSVGTSSYFIKREDYDYSITNTTTWATYNRNRKYDYKYDTWFSTANLGFGFTQKLSKTFDFRAESYFRFPTKKMGTGSLDVTSTGINIGVTKRLF